MNSKRRRKEASKARIALLDSAGVARYAVPRAPAPVQVAPAHIYEWRFSMRRVGAHAGYLGKLAGDLALRRRKHPLAVAAQRKAQAQARSEKLFAELQCRARLASDCVCGYCAEYKENAMTPEERDTLLNKRIEQGFRYEHNGIGDSQVYDALPSVDHNGLKRAKDAHKVDSRNIKVRLWDATVWNKKTGEFGKMVSRAPLPQLSATHLDTLKALESGIVLRHENSLIVDTGRIEQVPVAHRILTGEQHIESATDSVLRAAAARQREIPVLLRSFSILGEYSKRVAHFESYHDFSVKK